jgi:hypothetical protein
LQISGSSTTVIEWNSNGRGAFLLTQFVAVIGLQMHRYWYSARTLQSLVEELLASGATAGAFLSTPSVYFSLPKVFNMF